MRAKSPQDYRRASLQELERTTGRMELCSHRLPAMGIPDKWLELARLEAAEMRRAPVGAALIFIFGVVAGLYAGRLFYSERIEALNVRLSDYRERLNFVPAEDGLAKLTNDELGIQVDRLIEGLGALDKRSRSAWVVPTYPPGTTDETKNRMWAAMIQEEAQRQNAVASEFAQRFRGKALTLRRVMAERVPADVSAKIESRLADQTLETGLLAGRNPLAEVIAVLQQFRDALPRH